MSDSLIRPRRNSLRKFRRGKQYGRDHVSYVSPPSQSKLTLQVRDGLSLKRGCPSDLSENSGGLFENSPGWQLSFSTTSRSVWNSIVRKKTGFAETGKNQRNRTTTKSSTKSHIQTRNVPQRRETTAFTYETSMLILAGWGGHQYSLNISRFGKNTGARTRP